MPVVDAVTTTLASNTFRNTAFPTGPEAMAATLSGINTLNVLGNLLVTSGNYAYSTLPSADTSSQWVVNVSGNVIFDNNTAYTWGPGFDPSTIAPATALAFLSGGAVTPNLVTIASTGNVAANREVVFTFPASGTQSSYTTTDAGAVGIYTTTQTNIVNAGSIYGEGGLYALGAAIAFDGRANAGASLGGANAVRIDNKASGSIHAQAFEAVVNGSSATLTVSNRGEISASGPASVTGNLNLTAIVSQGTLILNNSGSLSGDVLAIHVNNRIINSGDIHGAVGHMPRVNDATGKVDMNFDGDMLDAEDVLIDTLNGLSVTNTGTIWGDSKAYYSFPANSAPVLVGTFDIAIAASGAKDRVVNGTATGLQTAHIKGDIVLLGGADALINYATITSDTIDMGAGTDTVTNFATGRIDAQIDLGDGTNVLVNGGLIARAVNPFDPSVDPVHIRGGNGTDTVTNSGDIGVALLRNGTPATGANSYTNLFEVLSNSGFSLYDTLLYRPRDLIDLGAGNDVLNNTGDIWGAVSGGSGNDRLNGSSNTDYFIEAAGNDRYMLSDGADAIFIAGDDGARDTIDGGTGLDVLVTQDFARQPGFSLGVAVDLKTGVLRYGESSDGGVTVTFGTASRDMVQNFEQVIGTNGDDSLYGTESGDSIIGMDGDDVIIGRGGADFLQGYLGDDLFIYNSIYDSGTTEQTSDMIWDMDFGDRIQLRFDTNADLAGEQRRTITDDSLLPDHFSGNAGSIRFLNGPDISYLELDVDGDYVSDFTIQFGYSLF